MLTDRALSVASCGSSPALEFFADFDFFSAIFLSWIIIEIQTHGGMQKANFAENKVNFVTGSGI